MKAARRSPLASLPSFQYLPTLSRFLTRPQLLTPRLTPSRGEGHPLVCFSPQSLPYFYGSPGIAVMGPKV